jgi:hypothetical protein
LGAFGSGTSIGQGISGKNMFTGEDLSAFDRGFHLTFGAAGAALDLGGALTGKTLSQEFPTFTRMLEGVSPQNATLQGGRLGNQAGAVRLGGESEPAKNLTLKAKSTGKQKSQYEAYVDYAKGYGKETDHYDATTNPGPLGPSPKAIETLGSKAALQRSVAATFAGGRYTTVQLEKPMVVYRAWAPGTNSKEFGGYWSLEKPQGSLQTAINSALKPEWSHLRDINGKELPGRVQATKWVSIEIQAGTQINVGQVGSQGGMWVGGGSQVVIDRNLQITEDLVRARGNLK